MNVNIESRQGRLRSSEERVYSFLSDFTNFKGFIPTDKIEDFTADENSCSFSVPGVGKAGLRIVEKVPFQLIKLTGEGTPFEFFLWMQFKQVDETDTRVKVTLKADLPMAIKMFATKPLTQFVEQMVDKLEQLPFN